MKAISGLLILALVWGIVSGHTYRKSREGIWAPAGRRWRAFSLLAACTAVIHFGAVATLFLNLPYSPLSVSPELRRLAGLGVLAAMILAIAVVLAAYAANQLEVRRAHHHSGRRRSGTATL